MIDIRSRLYLVTPLLADPAPFRPALEAACASDDVVAVLLRLEAADERTLVSRLKAIAPGPQAHDTAVILADPPGAGSDLDLAAIAIRGGADGAHSEDSEHIHELCLRLKEGRNVGAGGLRTRHDAMVAGEMGVDYVLFGEPRRDGTCPPLDEVVERVSWWVEIFQTPCVAYAPTLDDVGILARTGVEFVALGDAVWNHEAGPAAAVAEACRSLRIRESAGA